MSDDTRPDPSVTQPPHTVDRSAPLPPSAQQGIRQGGTFIGGALILIGLLVFVGRFVPWLGLFDLWPSIIIAMGIFQVFRTHGDVPAKRVAEGIVTIAFGLLLLGNTLGVIPWSAWLNMLSLWPLLLVALGFELLGKGLRMTWLRLLSNAVVLAGLFIGVFLMPVGSFGTVRPIFRMDQTVGESFEATAPATTTGRGELRLRTGGTKLTVRSGSDLAAISGTAPRGGAPSLETRTEDGVAAVTIVDDGSRGPFIIGDERRSLDLVLGRDIAWEMLTLDVGAVLADVDLMQLDVDRIELNAGASNVEMTVGDRSDCDIEISGGATNVILRLPEGAAVTVESRSGLSNVSVPAGYRHVRGVPFIGKSTWVTEGDGGPKLTVTLESGVSNLDITAY